MLQIARFSLLMVVALLFSGCNMQTFGSVAGGECKVFERPPYAVRGLRPYDQNWVDSQVEGGVGACGWKRPAPRPASIDAVRKAVAPTKKRGVIARAKAKLQDRVKSIWPVAAPPVPALPPVVAAPAPPTPKPRSAVDELLDPKGANR